MPTYVALLYSVVVSPQRRVRMEELRSIATGLGYVGSRTLVSTGNLVFEAPETALATLERSLEAAVRSHYGKAIDIIVRDGAAIRRLAAANPFPERSDGDGAGVHVRVMREPMTATTFDTLAAYCMPGDELALVDGDPWVELAGRASASKLLGPLSSKRLGIGTMRNWNTIRGLVALLDRTT